MRELGKWSITLVLSCINQRNIFSVVPDEQCV
jgi:hypothetical protein